MRKVFPLAAALLFSVPMAAQSPQFFRDISEDEVIQNAPRRIVPASYRTLALDFEAIKNWLAAAPPEAHIISKKSDGLPLSLPLPDGRWVDFEVWDAPVMHPDLAAKFPDIRSFSGRSLARDGTTVRFDFTPKGFHSMVLSPVFGSIFIDPYAEGSTGDYICYTREEFYKTCTEAMECHFDPGIHGQPGEPDPAATDRAGDCGKLHTYRLALACTGEYATYHGGTTAGALAAMNTSMTRVNGVYEKECSVRMTMIANNNLVVYLNSATDPYTNSNGSTMLGENQTNLDAVIGTANYDVGHVFSTGGGGVAYLNGPCNSTIKARGVTGRSAPVGDPFDIDYVAHEMGHQFGGNHTFYSNVGSCNGNMTNSRAFEPGSGSTIMAYAGICGSNNVQPNSDAYFHTASLIEMGIQVNSHTCDVETANGNNPPTIATIPNTTVPTGTPLVLTGDATDPDPDDAITYNWEQYNPHTSGALATMPPVGTNTKGPLFRSWTATAAPSRYFPKLANVVAGTTTTWEAMNSVARTLYFRLSVRDNNPLGGCTTQFPAASAGVTASATSCISLTASTTGAPFAVSYPTATGVSWPQGSSQTVTWNVIASATAVDILLSTDGGATFPTALATATANDGSETITVPLATPTNTASRIMVKANGNYFYDVSNNNFAITTSLPLELAGFEARPFSKNSVKLDWSTAAELALRGFHIERATGEPTGFEPIGFVESRGAAASYSFIDEKAAVGQVNYYRLFFEEKEGGKAGSYSPVRAVAVGASAGRMSIEPNPVFEKARLTFDGLSFEEGELEVEIFDASGVFIQKQPLGGGLEIDLDGLPSGTYTAVARAGGQVWSGRFVKF